MVDSKHFKVDVFSYTSSALGEIPSFRDPTSPDISPTIYPLQYIPYNISPIIYPLQYIPYNISPTIHPLQYIPYNRSPTIHPLQYISYNISPTIYPLQYIRYNMSPTIESHLPLGFEVRARVRSMLYFFGDFGDFSRHKEAG